MRHCIMRWKQFEIRKIMDTQNHDFLLGVNYCPRKFWFRIISLNGKAFDFCFKCFKNKTVFPSCQNTIFIYNN